MFDLVVEQHAGCCDQVGYKSTPDVAQGVLVERPPWRMGSTEEDGLDNVSKLCWRPTSRVTIRGSCCEETYMITTGGLTLFVLLAGADNVADL